MKKYVLCVMCGSIVYLCAADAGGEYLDYAASWPVSEKSLADFVHISRMKGNSSGINTHAKSLQAIEDQAAHVIAKKINAKAEQIHFTSGATDSNNMAILGVAYKHPKCHLITSKIEHKSVLSIFKHLEGQGYKVTYLDVDSRGKIDLSQLCESIRSNTKLISIQMLNSEIGVSQDIKSICDIARKNGILVHVDASQSFCKYEIDVEKLGVNLLTISGYKVGAPKGIGALYVSDDDLLQPIKFGSGDRLSPGTKPTALIKSFATAVAEFNYDLQAIHKLYNKFVGIISKISGVYVNSSPSHIVSVSIEGVLLKDLLERLGKYSFSAGCSCLGQEKSNVIAAIDPNNKLPSTTIRISFANEVDECKLMKFARCVRETIAQLRQEKNVGKNCETNGKSDKQKELIDRLDQIQDMLRQE